MWFRASETFWKNFYALSTKQKDSVRRKWEVFKSNPFHPSLKTHEIHRLSARAGATVYSVVIEADLRVIFKIDGDCVQTIDIGTHDIYR